MIKPDRVQVSWDAQKKSWAVRIQVGEEVVKRTPDHSPSKDAADQQLRTIAAEIAAADGYEIEGSAVEINR